MECHTCQRLALMLHPVCEGGHVHSVAGSLHCETPGIELAEAASLVALLVVWVGGGVPARNRASVLW